MRGKTFKKLGRNILKRVTSALLVVVMLFTMMGIYIPAETFKAATTVTIHFQKPSYWSNVKVHAWDNSDKPLLANNWDSRPLVQANPDHSGWYTVTATYAGNGFNYLFSANNHTEGNKEQQTYNVYIPTSSLNSNYECWATDGGFSDPGDGSAWKLNLNVTTNAPSGWYPEPEHSSPVVNGNQVTFNYFSKTASKVLLAGNMTDPEWEAGAKTMTDADGDGIHSITLNLQPGEYAYKFIVDGKWINDPKNTSYVTNSDNNKVVVQGFKDAKHSLKKGDEYTLPQKLTYVQSSGGTTTATVSYALKETYEEGMVTFDSATRKIVVDPEFEGDTVVLKMSATVSGKTVTGDYTINLVNKLFTYTIYAHSAVEARNSASAMGLWTWEKSDNPDFGGHELAFTEVELNGQKWLKAEIKETVAYKKIGFILKSKGDNVWTWKTPDIMYSNTSQTENVDLYLVDGYPTVYTSLSQVPQDRYVYVEYTRADGNYTNTNVYAWNTGYVGNENEKEVNYSYDFKNVNGKYIAKIPVVDSSADKTMGFLVRKGYHNGENWDSVVKDGGDNFVTLAPGQKYAKVRFENGAISYVLPDTVGSEIVRKDNVINFYYRDDERFLNNTLGNLQNVKVHLKTKTGSVLTEETVIAMQYDAVNERWYCSATLKEDTDYFYYYEVDGSNVLDSTTTRKDTIDGVEYSLRRNKSYNVNVVLDVTNNEMKEAGNKNMDYEDNAVLSVGWTPKTENDSIEGFNVEKAYADLSALGLGTKVEINPELMELTFGCLDSIEPGEKEIKVTIIDDCDMSYTGTIKVNVVEREKTVNTSDKLGDFDWDEAVIYFAVTDRFYDGDSNNNPTNAVSSKVDGSLYHGGDLKGLTEKIGYLYDLGVNTIWITPIVDNIDQNVMSDTDVNESYGYHGYWASDFTEMNPHLGDEDDLRALINAAHAKGMKIMVDIVINHAGYGTEEYFNKIIPVEGAFDADGNQVYKEMVRGTNNTVSGDDKLDSLSGLPDFVTEDAEVRAKLIEWQTSWMSEFGIDYYRVDTVKHVDETTWAEFKNELTKINSEFKLIGEYYDAGFYNDFGQLDSGMMDSVLDFNFNDVLTNLVDENMAAIEDAFNNRTTLLSNTGTMGSFLSSHDENGFLYSLITDHKESESWAKQLMKLAATYQMTEKGQPVIYYGEELGLTGSKEYPQSENRYDFDWAELAKQDADEDSMYNHYKKMLNIRRDYSEVFAKGDRYSVVYPNVQETHGNYTTQGYSIFARSYDDETIYIGTNAWGADRTVTFYVDGADGSKYKDVYNNKTYTVVDGTITITLPGLTNGNGTAVLVLVEGEKETVEDTNTITLKLHYDRTKNDYDNGTPTDTSDDWNAWVWGEGIETEGFKFVEENGEMVATITINDARSASKASFRMRKGDWKDNDHNAIDQTIDLSNIVSGTVHYYVNQGVWGGTMVLGADAIVGTKIVNAKYDRNTNSAIITTNRPVSGDVTSAFNFVCASDDNRQINIKQVTEDGCVYRVEFEDSISDMSEVIKSYTITFSGHTYTLTMPNIYTTKEFEDAYTYDGKDLGLTYDKEAGEFTFKVWAPTADDVSLNVYKTGTKGEDEGKVTFEMTKAEKGIWEYTLSDDYHKYYYTYTVNVLNEVNEVCDPYARTTGVNGDRAMILDLDTTDPEGWEEDAKKNVHKGMSYTDAIIYELHVRDLSSDASSGVSEANQGKFLGLTETGTTTPGSQLTGLDHMIDLGVTHVHLLPVYDYASVDETGAKGQQFNWGYDPLNYNVPEGSYSTNPYDGTSRVTEMKQMVKALHDNNINVIMDVVYNHVYDAGSFSVNQIVPNYFSRTDANGNFSNGSGCGNDTATERDMVHKFVVESILYWHEEYHIDGFRFDLVGLLDTITINKIVEEVHKIDPDIIFYGEGWTLGTALSEGKENYLMATQQNAWATPGFAYFSDTIRDNLAGNNTNGQGFIWANGNIDTLKYAFLGNSAWCPEPTQTINYASCHDNYTLMDKINEVSKAPYDSYDDAPGAYQVKLNNLAASYYMLSQGIPLIHAGEEFLRTKLDTDGTVIHNSYNASDYVNTLRWYNLDGTQGNYALYADTVEYYKGLIEFRKNHEALRLTTDADVSKVVTSYSYGSDYLVYKINGRKVAGEVADEIIIIYNASGSSRDALIKSDVGASNGTWKVCIDDKDAGTDVLRTVTISDSNGSVRVPANSVYVLVLGETVDNDSVYTRNNNVTITLDKAAIELKEGTSSKLTATVNPANSTLEWTSSNKNVATVDEEGNVTAVAAGTATITVSTLHGVTATCTVTVTEKQKVVLDKETLTLKESETGNIVAVATPNGTAVTWKSSDETVATIDENGKVTAVGAGTAIITVTTVAEGATATCTVTVKHDLTVVAGKDSTCTDEGVVAHYACDKCGKLFLDEACTQNVESKDVVVAAKGHKLTEVKAKDPACMTAGNEAYYVCETCSRLYLDNEGKEVTTFDDVTIDALGHDTEKVSGKEPTLTEAGIKEHYECNVCHNRFWDAEGTQPATEAEVTIAPLGHVLTKVGAKEATCTEAGVKEHYTCSHCDKLFTDETGTQEFEGTTVIPAKGHTEVKVEATSATCTTDGNIEHYKCSACNKLYTDATCTTELSAADVVVKASHKPVKLEATSATCTTDGNIEHYKCSACNKLYTDATCTTELSAADVVVKASHKPVKVEATNATCTTDGNIEHYKCSACNELYTDATCTTELSAADVVVAKGHKLTKVEEKAPTAEATGNKEYYVCGSCNKLFLDKDGKNETTLKDVTIPKLIVEPVYVPETKVEEQVSDEATGLVDKITDTNSTTNVVEDGIISEETLEKVEAAIEADKEIVTELVIENKKVDDIAKETVKLVEEAVKDIVEKATTEIAQYLDIKVLLKADDIELGTLNKLSEEITLTFEIPEDWKKEGRVFHVVRVHEGKTDILDVVENADGTVSFKTDRFSTYALAYTDPVDDDQNPDTPQNSDTPQNPDKPSAPQTGDSSQVGAYLLVLLAGLAITMASVANANKKHVK